MENATKPCSDRLIFKQALMHLRQGLVDLAIQDLEDLAKKSPESSAFWHELGSAYGKAGRDKDAFLAYKKSQQTRPCPSSPLQELARAFLERGDWENAMKALKQLSQIRPDLAEGFKSELSSRLKSKG